VQLLWALSSFDPVNRYDITTGLANAHLAFDHFIYFDQLCLLHANNPDQNIICEHVLGTLMQEKSIHFRWAMFD
jgi:hypothetical protein